MIRSRIIIVAILMLAAGWLVERDLARKVLQEMTADIPDRSEEVISVLTQRLPEANDVSALLASGRYLAIKKEFDLALPVLERAVALAPENRDSELLLAWTMLTALKNQSLSVETQSDYLAKSERALEVAWRLDPINPWVMELRSSLSKLKT